MKIIRHDELKSAVKEADGFISIFPRIQHLSKVFSKEQYKDAYAQMGAPVPDVTPNDLVKKYFPEQEVAFLIENKTSVITYTNKGCSISHFHGSNDKFIESDYDLEDTINTTFKKLSRLEREFQLSTPEGQIENDLKNRMKRVEVKRAARVSSLKTLPEDFWESIQHLAKWSTCFDEFSDVIYHNGDSRICSDRAIGRIHRALYALDNPRERSDEEFTIYRASGHDDEIEEGDWVTDDESYAEIHLRKSLNSKGCIHEVTAYKDEVYFTGCPSEAVYVERGTWKNFDSLESVYSELTKETKPLRYPEIKARTIEEINKDQSSEMTY
jgi:hypothetical protein